jgi:hypothetical protein
MIYAVVEDQFLVSNPKSSKNGTIKSKTFSFDNKRKSLTSWAEDFDSTLKLPQVFKKTFSVCHIQVDDG